MARGEKTRLLWANPLYRQHMSEVHKGSSTPTRLIAYIKSPYGRRQVSLRMKGRIPWNKGKRGLMTGEENPMWKGDNVGYRSLHKWVERELGKATQCMHDSTHKSTRYHWANISHEYKRDLSDWIQLCPRCNCLDKDGRRVSP